MAVTPDNSDCIVALFLHICRVDVLWHLIYLQNLSAINFIDTSCTTAFYAEFVWINLFTDYTLPRSCSIVTLIQELFNDYLAFKWVIFRFKALRLVAIIQ